MFWATIGHKQTSCKTLRNGLDTNPILSKTYARFVHFYEISRLGRLYTDFYAGDKPWTMRLLATVPPRLRPRGVERFLGRFDVEIPAESRILCHIRAVVLVPAKTAWHKRVLNHIYPYNVTLVLRPNLHT